MESNMEQSTRLCQGCGKALVNPPWARRYCDRKCQRAHWTEHRAMLEPVGASKTCRICAVEKPMDAYSRASNCWDGYRSECKACLTAAEQARDKSHRVSLTYEYKLKERLKRKYGMTVDEHNAMFAAQDERCAICRSDETGWNRKDIWPVDHDHDTGKVRGILCHHCNSLLGQARDSPLILLTAAAYLDRHNLTKEET